MNELELIEFTQWHMRCELLRYASRESCILSTRVLSDLLGRLGIQALPLAVGSYAVNAAAADRMRRGERPDDKDSGAFMRTCVHVGMPGDGEFYHGHVVLLAGGRYLCDPSADQFSYPDHDLIVTPLVIDLGDHVQDFLEGASIGARTPGGGAIAYVAHPEDTSYRDCSDWEDHTPGDKLYERLVATTLGLIDLYADGPMPDLPDLPRGWGAGEQGIDKEVEAAISLGYTPKDLASRAEREAERQASRKAAMERGELSPSLTQEQRVELARRGFGLPAAGLLTQPAGPEMVRDWKP